MASTVMSALFGSYDLRMAKQWRDEDMAYREQEIQWLNDDIVRAHQWRNADIERFLRQEKLENEHLLCEARAEQLSTVSEQCALLCGFTIAAISNVGIPDGLDRGLTVSYGVIVSFVTITLLLATVMCTMLLLAVTRYAGHTLEDSVKKMDLAALEFESPFSSWWLKKCEHEQMAAYKFMFLGVSLFFVYLSLVSWIQFGQSTYASTNISVLLFIGFCIWQLRIASRWRYLLKPPSSAPLTRSNSSVLSQRRPELAYSMLSMPAVYSPTTQSSFIESPMPYVRITSMRSNSTISFQEKPAPAPSVTI